MKTLIFFGLSLLEVMCTCKIGDTTFAPKIILSVNMKNHNQMSEWTEKKIEKIFLQPYFWRLKLIELYLCASFVYWQ